MEEIVIDAIVEAVIFAVRKDLINCLMDTECCKWSKRKVKKLCKKLQKRQDDMESIEEAKQTVRQSVSQLRPMNFSENSSLESDTESESAHSIPSGKLEDRVVDSKVDSQSRKTQFAEQSSALSGNASLAHSDDAATQEFKSIIHKFATKISLI